MLELSFGAGVGPPRRPQARLLFAVSLGFNIVNRRRRFAIGHTILRVLGPVPLLFMVSEC